MKEDGLTKNCENNRWIFQILLCLACLLCFTFFAILGSSAEESSSGMWTLLGGFWGSVLQRGQWWEGKGKSKNDSWRVGALLDTKGAGKEEGREGQSHAKPQWAVKFHLQQVGVLSAEVETSVWKQ